MPTALISPADVRQTAGRPADMRRASLRMPHSARTACSRWCVLIGLILTLVAPLGAQAAWADLYAAANGDRRWVVQVSPQEEEPAAWIYFQADPESDWMPLARLGSDVRGIAAIGP